MLSPKATLIFCGAILALSMAHLQAADQPATAPATRPTAAQIAKARLLAEAAKAIYRNMADSVDKGDLVTAGEMAEALVRAANQYKDLVKGTPLQDIINTALAHAERVVAALKAKDVDKAKTAIQDINALGPDLEDAVRRTMGDGSAEPNAQP
jgi:hypothetical protein